LVSVVFVQAGRAVTGSVASGPTVYIATGENFPDALGAGPAAAVAGGPILLVRQNSVPSQTATELSRLKPNKIVLVGGTGVISSGVETQLAAWAPVTRIAGTDRFDTAARISAATFPTTGGVATQAGGAGGKYASVSSPITLVDVTWTEIGALTVQIPGGGGLLDVSAPVGLTQPSGSGGSLVAVSLALDQPCKDTSTEYAGATVDVYNALYGSATLNTALPIAAGSHTLRTCAYALHAASSLDTTEVNESRISAVWVPTSVKGIAALGGPAGGQRLGDVVDRIKTRVTDLRN